MVVDVDPPRLRSLVIEGTLEFDNGGTYVLEATYIVVRGGRLLVGWGGEPFTGDLEIRLHGSHSTPEYTRTDGPNIGSKVLGKPCRRSKIEAIGDQDICTIHILKWKHFPGFFYTESNLMQICPQLQCMTNGNFCRLVSTHSVD